MPADLATSRSREPQLPAINPVWMVLTTGIVLSVATFLIVRHQLELHRGVEFQWAAHNRFRSLQKEAGESLEAIDELVMLLGMSQDRSAHDLFSQAALMILERHPNLSALAFLPSDGGKIGIAPTAEEPLWRRVMEEHHLDGPQLLEEIGRGGGQTILLPKASADGRGPLIALILRPIIDPAVPPGKTAVIAALLRIDNLVTSSLDPLEPRGIDIWITRAGDGVESPVYFYASRLTSEPRADAPPPFPWKAPIPSLQAREEMRMLDQNLFLTAAATHRFRSAQAFTEGPWIILFEGLVFTGILTLYFLRLRREMLIRREMEAALVESGERLRMVLEYSPDVIMTLNADGRIIYMNHPFPERKLGLREGALLSDRLPPDQREKLMTGLKRAHQQNLVDHFLLSLPDLTCWEMRLVPLEGDEDDPVAMAIVTDVTENRILHAQAVRSARLASLGVLAASVAHEINNPNNAIRFNATSLSRIWEDLSPAIRRLQDEEEHAIAGGMPMEEMYGIVPRLFLGIENATRRIEKIVADLKHMARDDHGDMSQRIHVSELIRSTLSILYNPIRKSTDHLKLLPLPPLPPVLGNAQQLEQVLVNVVLNGLESLPNRQAGLTLSASLQENGEMVEVMVADEGCGISDESMEKITDPFFTTKGASGGIGLGLSISKRILAAHGGHIHFHSEVGKGTRVTLLLPVHQSHGSSHGQT